MSELHRVRRIEELPKAIRPYDALRCYPDQAYACVLENPGEPSPLGRWSLLCAKLSHPAQSSFSRLP